MTEHYTTSPSPVPHPDSERWLLVERDALLLVERAIERVTGEAFDGLALDAQDRFETLLRGSLRALEVAVMPRARNGDTLTYQAGMLVDVPPSSVLL